MPTPLLLRRARVPGTALPLCLMLVLGLVIVGGIPANASTVTKMTCVVKVDGLFAPALSATYQSDVTFAGDGPMICRVKPNDPQVLKGFVFIQSWLGYGTCTSAVFWTNVAIALVSADGDMLTVSLTGTVDLGSAELVRVNLDQNDSTGHPIGSGSGQGVYLPLLPAPLCAKAAGGSSSGGTLVFDLTMQVVPTRVGP